MITNHKGISIICKDKQLFSKGLNLFIGKEISIQIQSQNCGDYLRIMKYFINYIVECKPFINNGETIVFGSWSFKFVLENPDYYDIFEASNNGDGYTLGTEYALKVINDQEEECLIYTAHPVFPTFNQKIVISKGVYEMMAVQAVRYPSPDHMCGWWITTDLYDGKIKSLLVVHFYHVAFARPDLLRYLALPNGYRFYISDNEIDVWFDETILLNN